jgi:hypothetical protein
MSLLSVDPVSGALRTTRQVLASASDHVWTARHMLPPGRSEQELHARTACDILIVITCGGPSHDAAHRPHQAQPVARLLERGERLSVVENHTGSRSYQQISQGLIVNAINIVEANRVGTPHRLY